MEETTTIENLKIFDEKPLLEGFKEIKEVSEENESFSPNQSIDRFQTNVDSSHHIGDPPVMEISMPEPKNLSMKTSRKNQNKNINLSSVMQTKKRRTPISNLSELEDRHLIHFPQPRNKRTREERRKKSIGEQNLSKIVMQRLFYNRKDITQRSDSKQSLDFNIMKRGSIENKRFAIGTHRPNDSFRNYRDSHSGMDSHLKDSQGNFKPVTVDLIKDKKPNEPDTRFLSRLLKSTKDSKGHQVSSPHHSLSYKKDTKEESIGRNLKHLISTSHSATHSEQNEA